MNESQEKWKMSFLRKHFIMNMVAGYCFNSLYSRSRCTNVDSTFGMTKIITSWRTEYGNAIYQCTKLILCFYYTCTLSSNFRFLILMVMKRISYQKQICYPSVAWDLEREINIWNFHIFLVPSCQNIDKKFLRNNTGVDARWARRHSLGQNVTIHSGYA